MASLLQAHADAVTAPAHVLVTGAGGFSGSEITRALLEAGCRVTAYVGTSRGRLPGGAFGQEQLAVVAADLSREFPNPGHVDTIVHAAARSPAPGITTDRMVRDNVIVTRNVVDAAGRFGAKKIIYLSSLSVYGRIETLVVDEQTPVCDPDVYGMTKMIGEELVRGAGVPSISIRLPGVLGRGSVRNWLTSILQEVQVGNEISIFNPDAPFNNAVHISDLCDLISGLVGQSWNRSDFVTLGAAGHMQVKEIVEYLIRETNSTSSIKLTNSKKVSFTISSQRAQEIYGYRPMDMQRMLNRFVTENTEIA
jgi:UDP-glucose 4-epimerase